MCFGEVLYTLNFRVPAVPNSYLQSNKMANLNKTFTGLEKEWGKYPYPGEPRPSERYRKQRKVQTKVVNPLRKEAQRLRSAAKTASIVANRAEKKERKLKALKKHDGEFDEFLCEAQVLEGYFSTIVDKTQASQKILQATDHVQALADNVGKTITESVSSVRDFLNINTGRINTQCVLAAITVARSQDFLTIILEILKLLNNYTDVLTDCLSGACSWIWNHIHTMVQWARGTFYNLTHEPSQGSITGTAAEAQSGLEEFIPSKQFWNTAGALAVGVGALFGSTLVLGNSHEVSAFAFKAYRRAAENVAVKKLQNGLESFLTVCMDSIKKSMTSLIPEGTFLPAIEEWFREEKIDMAYFIAEVNTLIDPTNRDTVLYGDGAELKIEELTIIAQLIEIAIAEKKLEPTSAQMCLVRQAIRNLMEFAIKYQYAHTELVRDTPFVVCIFSKPGVGKSVMTSAFAHNICAPQHGCTVEMNRDNLLYFRSSADKYYTNYRGQPVFVVDDWAQCRNPSPENSEMRDFISMVSSVPWAPSQAGVDEKGRPYNSKLVIVTTNVPYPKPNEISDAGAIYRRRNFMIEMVVLESKKHLPLEDHRRYGFYLHDNAVELRLNHHPLTFQQIIKDKLIPAFNQWDAKNQTIKQIGVIDFEVEGRSLVEVVQASGIKCRPESGIEEVIPEDLLAANPAVPYVPPRENHLTFQQMLNGARHRANPSTPHNHIFDRISKDWDAGVRVAENYVGWFACLCCGSSACGQSSDGAIGCVPNYDENSSHWSSVKMFQAHQYMDDFNNYAFNFGGKMLYCYDTNTLIYREEQDLPYTRHVIGNSSTWEHDPDVYSFFKIYAFEEYNDYFIEYNDDEFLNFMEAESRDAWYLRVAELVNADGEDEVDEWEPQAGEEETAPKTLTPDQEAWACEPIPLLAPRKPLRVQIEEQQKRQREEHLKEKLKRDFPVSGRNPVSYHPRTEHMQFWNGASAPIGAPDRIASEEERQAAQAMIESARDADTEKALQAIADSERVNPAIKWALKAVACCVVVFASIKAMQYVTSFFGTSRKKLEVRDAEGEIQTIIADFPPTLKTVAGDILRVTISELAASAVNRVIRAEGGASAYGEALTVKAARRRNLKFASNIEKAVRMQVNESVPDQWLCDEQVAELLEAQGSSDNQGMDLIRHIVGPKNSLSLKRENESGGNRIFTKGLAVAGRLIVVPWHFMPAGFPVLDTEIAFGPRVVKTSIDYSKARRVHNGSTPLDLAFIELDHSFECFKDIRKHFVGEADLKRLDKFKSMLVLHQTEVGGYYISSNYIQSKAITGEEGFYYEPTLPEKIHYDILKGFKYALPTQKGDCGAVLIALDPTLQGRICGMHIAGQKKLELGLATPLTREVIDYNINKHFPDLYISATAEANIVLDQELETMLDRATVLPEGELELVGNVQPMFAQRFPRRTDLVPSLLYDKVYEHQKEPSVLSGRDPRIDKEVAPAGYESPMQEGILKYTVPITKPFSSSARSLAAQVLLSEYERLTLRGMTMRVLTDDEMINGVPSAGFTAMDMSTSPGMPYKLLRPPGCTGKHAFFNYDERTQKWEWDLKRKVAGGINPATKLREDIAAFEEAAITGGKIPFHYNYENLKQETLAIPKIKAGKTRLFSCTPLAINMLIRKYFGAWVALMNQNCVQSPSAVGINPMGFEWTELAYRLHEKGDAMIAGDYQKWDGKVCGAIMATFVDRVINSLYEDNRSEFHCVDNRVRLALIDYCIHCPTLVGSTLLQTHFGLPSGVSITSDVNSGVNSMYKIIAFIEMRRKHQCPNCKNVRPMDYFKYCAETNYGDDHTVSVAKEARCFFTFNTLKTYFEEHGIGYTDALKTGKDAPDFLSLDDVSYLKRRFDQDEDSCMMRAPLELVSVKDQLNWVRTGGDPVDAVLQNAEGVMREMFMHGREQYEVAAQQVKDGLTRLRSEMTERGEEGFAIPVWSYEEEAQRWRDDMY